jgi:hypothetical protein
MRRIDLESAVHEELRALPLPPAPPTLLPRVLAAVEAWARRPWYSRTWFTWPGVWQAVSIAAVAVVAAAAVVGTPWVLQSIEETTAVTAARILWRTLAAPLVPYLFAVVMLMCLACAAVGTALNRLAFGRT